MPLFRIVCLLALACFGISLGTPARASGLLTHTWIAERIIEDLSTDCKLVIGPTKQELPRDVCLSIRNNPNAFRAGMLGPDVYPDLITGQVTTHPGIKGDWQTSDWLRSLYGNAREGPELAFAAGYATHAAVDSFAHSYVNNYSGDIFELKDERRVELRHFSLEKYVDYRLPSTVNIESVDPPVDFVVERLLYNDDVSRLARKSGAAPHMVAMNGVRVAVDEADRGLAKLDEVAAKVLTEVIASYLGLTKDIATNQHQLQLASATLDLNEQRLSQEKELLDRAYKAFQDASAQAEDAERRLNELRNEILALNNRISDAERLVTGYNDRIADLEKTVPRLSEELRKIAKFVAEDVCDKVCRNVKTCIPYTDICTVNKVCAISACYAGPVFRQILNPVWKAANDRLEEATSALANAKRDLANMQTRLAADTARKAVALNEKVEAEALSLRYAGVRKAAELAYTEQKLRYEAQLSLTRQAKAAVDDIKAKLKELGDNLIRVSDIKAKIESFIQQLKPVSFYTANWRRGIRRSGEEYIRTSSRVAVLVANSRSGAFDEVRKWVTCYGGAFTPVPYQAGEFGCQVQSEYEQLQDKVDDLILDVLPPPFDALYEEYAKFKARINGELKNVVSDAGKEVIHLAAPDSTTAEFIELLGNPKLVTRDRLNEVFATAADANGKNLLVFDQVSDLIDADMGLKSERLDPFLFRAFRHSGTMARLALLDFEGVREITWRLGGNPSELPPQSQSGRYTIMAETVRSIDGNHQWQAYGLPYPRQGGEPEPRDPSERRYGYGVLDSAPKGMPLFATDALRRDVFRVLFPGGIAGAVRQRDELKAPIYPFQECDANPFPVSVAADGTAAENDDRCTSASKPQKSPFSIRWKRFWRSLLAPLGAGPRRLKPGT